MICADLHLGLAVEGSDEFGLHQRPNIKHCPALNLLQIETCPRLKVFFGDLSNKNPKQKYYDLDDYQNKKKVLQQKKFQLLSGVVWFTEITRCIGLVLLSPLCKVLPSILQRTKHQPKKNNA